MKKISAKEHLDAVISVTALFYSAIYTGYDTEITENNVVSHILDAFVHFVEVRNNLKTIKNIAENY